MMKKTAIALGIAAMACGAQAAEVFKNADTAIEVNLDLQFYNLNVVETADTTARNYIKGDGTQAQFKASKVINEDLTVFGQIELDGDPVGDNATLLTDDMKFGLTSKTWGTIQLGQFDSFMEDELMEMTNSFIISKSDAITEPTAGNDGRHILWKHKIGSLAVGVDLTQGYNAASSATDGTNGVAFTATYTMGDLKLAAGSSTIARYNSSTYAANSFKGASGFGASYTLNSAAGVTKFNLLSATNTSYSTTAAYDGLDTKYNSGSIVHTFGQWNVGVLGSARSAAATSSTVDATEYQETAYQVVYDLGKGARLYATNSNLGASGGKGNFTEVGFLMSF